MDFLKQGLGQVADLFLTMTPAARLTTGMLLAVLVVSFVYLFRQNVEGEGVYLFDAEDISGAQISEMESVFAKEGLEDAVRVGYRIRVPAAEKWKYMAALGSANLMPANASTPYENMFKESSLLDSRPVMELRERIATQQRTAHMLTNLKGIQSATVQIYERDKGGFPRTKVRTAVAAVKAIGAKHLDRVLINTIRDMVSGSAGTDRENVTVADTNANLSFPGSGKDGMPLADEDPYMARVRLEEDRVKRRIENLLANYRGILVEVHAELGTDFINREERLTYDAQPVNTESSSSTKLDTSITSADGGRPGTASNGLGNTAQQVSAAATINNKNEVTTEETKAVPGATLTTVHKAGFKPERITASIRIPRSLWREIWLVENPPVDGEDVVEPDQRQLDDIQEREINAIKDMVSTLLPPPEPGEDTHPLVTVEPYTATPIADPDPPGVAANAGNWFASNWQTIALFLAAIFSVFFLRGMVRADANAPPRAATAGDRQSVTQDGMEDDDIDESDVSNSLRDKAQHSGRSLRDELTELVHEDPDAAANVLANWIGDAA